MSEPILSHEELVHAARAILMAVLGAPHDIERGSVIVHFDDSKPRHNALNQMSGRIETELAAVLEKICGEPIYQARQLSEEDDRWDDVYEATHFACSNEPKFYETRIVYALTRSKP
ncbi:hypothetical protein LL999_23165 [Burkholderia ambifaria]|uniref:hypothetical protein n=1 Tax=Burkholderia ambifaria TaxID=152480 RepID=UPI001E420932|nr:hypothetical protein [Burkholderia ambifaria]UEP23147.1 hypothetical protein LL999_23165 [Burkholderia ambifaria]